MTYKNVERLVEILDRAKDKLEVNYPNTSMEIGEVRAAVENMAWEIAQHCDGAREACNERDSLRAELAKEPT